MTQVTQKFKIESCAASETQAFGKRLAKKLRPGDTLCCYGGLGAGKTTLIKGIADGLNIKSDYVHSPTFTLMNIYEHGKIPLYHFDLYRIERAEQMFDIGYEEFLYGDGIAVVEWSEHFGVLLPKERLEIHLTHKSAEKRGIVLKAFGERYKKLIEYFL